MTGVKPLHTVPTNTPGQGGTFGTIDLGGNIAMSKRRPVIGNWYQDAAEDELFEVVAVDDDGSIAIQYVNGDISEIDLETWAQMVLLPAQPPDDLNELEDLMSDEDEEGYREPSWEDPFNNDLEGEDYDEY